jgi:hypothetical protein
MDKTRWLPDKYWLPDLAHTSCLASVSTFLFVYVLDSIRIARGHGTLVTDSSLPQTSCRFVPISYNLNQIFSL